MKKLCVVLLCLLIAVSLFGCSTHEVQKVDSSPAPSSMFVMVEDTSSWKIVYHKDTGVMYAVSDSTYNYGTFTLLVDADGWPLIYDGFVRDHLTTEE